MSAKQPIYIEVCAGVRYWEDATINGIKDANGTLTPFKRGDDWCPVIRLSDGVVMDWPIGTVADIHFKVCDDGEYWLLDKNKKRIGQWASYYVPNYFLCHRDNGYGDYIIMFIDDQGTIENWSTPEVEWLKIDDSGAGWKALEGGAA